MKRFTHIAFSILVLFGLTYCGGASEGGDGTDTTQTDSAEATTDNMEKKYTLTEITSPEFADASLGIKNVEEGAKLEAGTFKFEFEVANYELGAQTEDAAEKGLANSPKGQHIHFILNNDPYSAHYEPMAEKELPEGKHVLLAFLSRSYHESVKNAFLVRSFQVGESEEGVDFDPEAKHLFYSRPKGEYKGADTEKLLLDFFLVNITLSEDGDKVRATINGEEHIITKWAPYVIEGLEKGELTVKLELIDAEGNVIPGPFNTVERTVTLSEGDDA